MYESKYRHKHKALRDRIEPVTAPTVAIVRDPKGVITDQDLEPYVPYVHMDSGSELDFATITSMYTGTSSSYRGRY